MSGNDGYLRNATIFLAITALVCGMMVSSVASESVGSESVDLDFSRSDVRDILRTLANVSGRNIVLDRSVEGEMTINPPDPVPRGGR